jgi:hypothetical protein
MWDKDQRLWQQKVLDRFDRSIGLQQQTNDSLKAILVALQKKAVKIKFYFRSSEGEISMALTLPVGITDKYYINALDADGDPGATLAPGQLITVVASDPSIVLTPDASPAIDPKTNIQSAASGSVAIGPTPQIGTPITVTATLTAADGVTAVDTETDTVTAAVGSASKIGILFEDTSLNPSPAGGKRK